MPKAAYLSPDMHRITGGTLRPGGLALTDRAMELCRFTPGDRLLDIGCGTGATVNHLNTAYGMSALGLDLSAEMIAKTTSPPSKPFGLVQADGMALPLFDGSMDGIFCECVLSRMPDPSRSITDCYRTLRPKGRLIITDLYVRRPSEGENLPGIQGSGCLAGAREKEVMVGMVQDAGFRIQVWEDFTQYLTQLAADIIFSRGSLDWFYNFMGNGSEIKKAACQSKPGYFLLIAQKAEAKGPWVQEVK